MEKPLLAGVTGVASVADASANAARFRHAGERTLLLQAAEALERAEAHNEKLIDALRYFVDLGSDDQPRELPDVKPNLANAHVLIHSSAAISLKIRELAFKCRVLAPEEAMLGTNTPMPNECPAVPVDLGSPQKEQDEQERVDTVLSEIEFLLGKPTADKQLAAPLDPVPIPRSEKEWIEQKHAAVLGSKIDGLNLTPEREGKPATSLSADPLQRKPDEPKTDDPISQEIEALLGKDAISVFSEAEIFLANSRGSLR